jgi:hypothetical protein
MNNLGQNYYKIKKYLFYPVIAIFLNFTSAQNAHADGDDYTAGNDTTWETLGTNENDSMPIGNGDLAANVWTEQNGDIVLLVAKSDSWSESGELLKLGRVRVQLTPNPFVGTANFTQALKLENASVQITSGANVLRIWADANQPVIHVEATLEHPATLQARLELWRAAKADMFLPAAGQVVECHFNLSSLYTNVLVQEHLQSVLNKYPDPLLHRCFGATLTGPGLISVDDHTLQSSAEKDLRLNVVALTETAPSPQDWEKDLDSSTEKIEATSLDSAWDAHCHWWDDFWNRSWIHVTGDDDACRVSQGYIMQRYMMACSSRGAYPVKFNGGLFTVGHDMPDHQPQNNRNHNPDYRAWDGCYWNQNNRLLYWPLIETGDFDLLKPWFSMYLHAWPLGEDRARVYYHHGGALLPETMYFWGLPSLGDFGRNNPITEIQSHWQRYHIQGTLEVISQMLDEYDMTRDIDFARTNIVPFADAIVTYYAEHWPRSPDEKIRMAPTQSLETYQLDAVNPTPDIAGLKSILPRLLTLPRQATFGAQRKFWAKTLADLPPIPLGRTANGKLPPFGVGDTNGTLIIFPAEKYGKTSNGENPELYVAFPYRLYGVGKPDLKLAKDTFAARRFPQDTCWGQDGTQASILGLTDVATKAVVAEFTDYGDQRFPWFWKPGHDWIPDLDNGGSGMITLQNMLMQCDGERIQLLPAWPADWTTDFKLHAPYNTTVEGHVENGKITELKVTPSSRAKDVVVLPTQ